MGKRSRAQLARRPERERAGLCGLTGRARDLGHSHLPGRRDDYDGQTEAEIEIDMWTEGFRRLPGTDTWRFTGNTEATPLGSDEHLSG